MNFKEFCVIAKDYPNYKILKKERLVRKWYKNRKAQYPDDDWNYTLTVLIIRSFSSFLNCSFTFKTSFEGWDFWRNYYVKYENIENEKCN